MKELFTYLSRLTIPDLVLCAAAVVILDLFAFAVILSAYKESNLCKKRWEKVGANMELRMRGKNAEGNTEILHFPLEADEILLGRHISADIRLPDESVSRYHALMTVTGGVWSITDLGSKSGTFVNGNRIQQTSLQSGDVIQFGTMQMKFTKKPNPQRGGQRNV